MGNTADITINNIRVWGIILYCESGQFAKDHNATSPGFYFNELLFTLTGPMNFGISNQYLPINKIVLVGSENNLPVIDVQAPP